MFRQQGAADLMRISDPRGDRKAIPSFYCMHYAVFEDLAREPTSTLIIIFYGDPDAPEEAPGRAPLLACTLARSLALSFVAPGVTGCT